MATIYVDSAATGLDDGTSWTDAYLGLGQLITGEGTLSDGDIVYVASGSVDTNTTSGSKTLAGPTTGEATFISVTSGTTTYAKSATNQFFVPTSGSLTLDGSFAMYGIQLGTAGSSTQIVLAPANDEKISMWECTLAVGDRGYISPSGLRSKVSLINCTVDLSADTTTTTTQVVFLSDADIEMLSTTFTGGSNRTGNIFEAGSGVGTLSVHGADLSGFTNATVPEIFLVPSGAACVYNAVISNCKLYTTNSMLGTTVGRSGTEVTIQQCGTGNNPEQLAHMTHWGRVESDTANYRDSGATVEGVNVAWEVGTEATCGIDSPYYTPWIYANVDATGSTIFDMYITHDANPAADFDDDEVWMELQYKDTASSGEWVTDLADKVATRTTAGSPQTDDTTSTWTGADIAETYKQKLTTTVTVNTVGLVRARVGVAYPSITSADDFYIDPKLYVT
jgi:hypothetical protein